MLLLFCLCIPDILWASLQVQELAAFDVALMLANNRRNSTHALMMQNTLFLRCSSMPDTTSDHRCLFQGFEDCSDHTTTNPYLAQKCFTIFFGFC